MAMDASLKDSAAVDHVRIGFALHERPTDGEGHIYAQHAERRRVDEVEQAVYHTVSERGDELLVAVYGEGLDDQDERADNQDGYHVHQTAAHRAHDGGLLHFAHALDEFGRAFARLFLFLRAVFLGGTVCVRDSGLFRRYVRRHGLGRVRFRFFAFRRKFRINSNILY